MSVGFYTYSRDGGMQPSVPCVTVNTSGPALGLALLRTAWCVAVAQRKVGLSRSVVGRKTRVPVVESTVHRALKKLMISFKKSH